MHPPPIVPSLEITPQLTWYILMIHGMARTPRTPQPEQQLSDQGWRSPNPKSESTTKLRTTARVTTETAPEDVEIRSHWVFSQRPRR